LGPLKKAPSIGNLEINQKYFSFSLKKQNGKIEKLIKVHLISVSACCQLLLSIPQVLLPIFNHFYFTLLFSLPF
jgi:hypothetical protein